MPTPSRPFLNNSYIRIAQAAIESEGKPLSAKRILDVAYRLGVVPRHLYGKTQHKTLNARLSEHIRTYKYDALFYRTGPAVYFLTSLASAPTVPSKYKHMYRGIQRSKQIRNERVLVMKRAALEERIAGDFVGFDDARFKLMFDDECFFMDRREAEQDQSVKQFVSYALVHNGRSLLCYRRGKFSTAKEEIRGAKSIGFGGHVADIDFDMFCQGEVGLLNNLARELFEELYIDDFFIDDPSHRDRASILGYINVDHTAEARQHVAVVMAFRHGTANPPRKGELSINDLRWIDLCTPVNDIQEYELWSRMLLERLYGGRLAL